MPSPIDDEHKLPLSTLPLASPQQNHAASRCQKDTSHPRLLSFSAASYRLAKQICMFVVLLGLFCWYKSGRLEELNDFRQAADSLTKKLLLPPGLERSHFVPASHQHIRYVGRWVQTPNRLRKDSHFSGAYLEFAVQNCSSVYISLHNADLAKELAEATPLASETSKISSLEFHSLSSRSSTSSSSPPANLMSQVDGKYTSLFQAAKGILSITDATLSSNEDHVIRLTNLGLDDETPGGVEFEGIWIDDGGSLISTDLERTSVDRDQVSTQPSKWANNGSAKLAGLAVQVEDDELDDHRLRAARPTSKKTVEIVSDMTSLLGGSSDSANPAPIMGWDKLLGEILDVDQVSIALDGMCVINSCIGGRAQPASVQDAFFRSGPPNTISFARPWNFHSYIPDVMILILGSSDDKSFRRHHGEYGKSEKDLQRKFEDTYVKFVWAIRRAAYPLHPAALHDYSSNGDGFVFNSAPATIPIFIVTPFTGQMSHSSRKVVEKLQAEGDKSVFWLDTSGWFSREDFESKTAGDPAGQGEFYLNAQGNRKAAVFLQAHLCPHLAEDEAQCPFLKHEAYTGQAYVPQHVEMEKAMEESKLEKLKSFFWSEIISESAWG